MTGPHHTTPRAPKADLGVLFVHGIGTQQRGDTLLQFAEPIVHWIQTRGGLEAINTPTQLSTTLLLDQDDDSRTPAHTRLDFGSHGEEARWLFAESQWADSFQPPGLGELAKWLFLVAPWVMDVHSGRALARSIERVADSVKRTQGCIKQRKWKEALWGLNEFILLAQSETGHLIRIIMMSIGGILAQMAIPLVAFMAALPIPLLKSVATYAQQTLSKVLGDSHVLVQSPFRFSAMAYRVQRDLSWLAERSERVIVVAHSQGAVVAKKALESASPDLLITVGAGINKLNRLNIAKASDRFRWTSALRILGLIGVSIGLWLFFFGGQYSLGSLCLFVGVAIILFCAFAPLYGCEISPQTSDYPWVDYYASRDPVPNGPTLESAGHHTSTEITNIRSLGGDHTSYWNNLDVFVSHLVGDLAECAAGPPRADVSSPYERVRPSQDEIETAEARRLYRATWRSWSLAVSPFAAVFSWICIEPFYGEEFRAWLNASAKNWEQLASLASHSQAISEALGRYPLLLASVLAIAVVELAAQLMWAAWNNWDQKHFLNKKPSGIPSILFRCGFGLLQTAPWIAILGVSTTYVPAELSLLRALIPGLAGVLLLTYGLRELHLARHVRLHTKRSET